MLGDILRRLLGGGSASKTKTFWHWRCECGGHSRGGDFFKADAEQNAYLHQNRKGVGHPAPEVYSTQEPVARG